LLTERLHILNIWVQRQNRLLYRHVFLNFRQSFPSYFDVVYLFFFKKMHFFIFLNPDKPTLFKCSGNKETATTKCIIKYNITFACKHSY